MKHHSIIYTPRAEVSFTRDELALMMECSTNHYDSRCRDYSSDCLSDGSLGLLCGMLKQADNGFDGPRLLSFRELDTLAKILEVGRYLGMPKASEAMSLGLALRKVLIELNESAIEPKAIT